MVNKIKIILTKRKITRAGRFLLWSNIFFTLLWSLNLVAFIRCLVKYGQAFLYQTIGLMLIIPLIAYWISLFIEPCFMKRYEIKLDAEQKDGE